MEDGFVDAGISGVASPANNPGFQLLVEVVTEGDYMDAYGSAEEFELVPVLMATVETASRVLEDRVEYTLLRRAKGLRGTETLVEEIFETNAAITIEMQEDRRCLSTSMRKTQALAEVRSWFVKEKPDCGRIVVAQGRLRKLSV